MAKHRFTTEQERVIAHDGGHALVSAVAGSGKTETMVARLGRLVQTTSAARIAVVMFNRDAAEDFRRRFRARIGTTPPEIRTFNSMGERITQRLMAHGHLSQLRLCVQEGRRARLAAAALAEAFAGRNGKDARPDKELQAAFLAFIGLVKADVESPAHVFAQGSYAPAAQCFLHAYELYEKARMAARVRFYEDQVHAPVLALLRAPALQAMVSNRLDHLIVDEAQDVNGVQIQLMRILAGDTAKVMIVGDEDQSIYGWRGAKPKFMAKTYPQHFRNPVRYVLPHTFRFGHALAIAANHVIGRNRAREPKRSLAVPTSAPTVVKAWVSDPHTPTAATLIESARKRVGSWSEMAVLVRTYDVAVPIEMALLKRKIPYFVYGRAPLLRVPEISALMGVLQLAAGWSAVLSVEERTASARHMLTTPTLYLPGKTLDALAQGIANDPRNVATLMRKAITATMQPYQAARVRDRADSVEIVATATPPDMTAAALLEQYLATTTFETSVRAQSATPEIAEGIIANVRAFVALAADHGGTVQAFRDSLDPLADAREQAPPQGPHVWIGSIHRAKGAEWPIVLVPALAAGSFPRSSQDAEQIEAERRLFYVAITRARQEIHLIHPPDEAFASALADPTHPDEIPPDSAVSRFLWETRVALANQAAGVLEHGGVPGEADAPGVVNDYLQAMGHPGRFTQVRRTRRPTQTSAGSAPPGRALKPGDRINLVVLGRGRVESWVDARIVRVQLDSGDSRLFVADMMQFVPAGNP